MRDPAFIHAEKASGGERDGDLAVRPAHLECLRTDLPDRAGTGESEVAVNLVEKVVGAVARRGLDHGGRARVDLDRAGGPAKAVGALGGAGDEGERAFRHRRQARVIAATSHAEVAGAELGEGARARSAARVGGVAGLIDGEASSTRERDISGAGQSAGTSLENHATRARAGDARVEGDAIPGRERERGGATRAQVAGKRDAIGGEQRHRGAGVEGSRIRGSVGGGNDDVGGIDEPVATEACEDARTFVKLKVPSGGLDEATAAGAARVDDTGDDRGRARLGGIRPQDCPATIPGGGRHVGDPFMGDAVTGEQDASARLGDA